MVKIRDIISDAQVNELDRNDITPDDMWVERGENRSNYKDTGIVIDDLDVLYKKQKFGNGLFMGVWDGTNLIGEMEIDPVTYQGVKAYSVHHAVIDKEYQGQGIGWALYQGLISILGINLLSNGSHSVGARKMWLKLAQDPKIRAYGFDQKTDQLFIVKPNKQKSELVSAKKGTKLYDNYGSGLILVKRNGPSDKRLERLLKQSTIKQPKDPFGTEKFSPLEID